MAYKYKRLVLTSRTPWRGLRQLGETHRRIKKYYNHCSQSAARSFSFKTINFKELVKEIFLRNCSSHMLTSLNSSPLRKVNDWKANYDRSSTRFAIFVGTTPLRRRYWILRFLREKQTATSFDCLFPLNDHEKYHRSAAVSVTSTALRNS